MSNVHAQCTLDNVPILLMQGRQVLYGEMFENTFNSFNVCLFAAAKYAGRCMHVCVSDPHMTCFGEPLLQAKPFVDLCFVLQS